MGTNKVRKLAKYDLSAEIDEMNTFAVVCGCLLQDTDKSACINDINEDVTNAGESLMGVTDEMAECIWALGDCQPLVTWLCKLNGNSFIGLSA